MSKRTFEQAGFNITVARFIDNFPDLSFLTQDYKGESPEKIAMYQAQDRKRLVDYDTGYWHMVGLCVTIQKQTASNWADGGLEVGRASIWGLESDCGEEFFATLEKDMIERAFDEVKHLTAALCGKNN